ncbi:MAG: sucrose-6-phosphate hydrolase [Nitrospirae bacterium]|nr:sucrose-6-phosphate hydrolase [Nitrospirota bacterium]
MGKPYTSELSQLSKTLDWASTADIDALRRVVLAAKSLPLMAVGSGGSLTAAHLLSAAHRRYTGQQASVVTPLDSVLHSLDPSVSVWMLSAGGSNVDILAAFSSLVRSELAQLVVVCGRRQSRLTAAATEHQFVDVIDAEGPAGKDGFLATNSLIAASVLICRAYSAVFNSDLSITQLQELLSDGRRKNGGLSEWKRATQQLWSRETLVVLYGPATHAAAIDLESKFTEAALGNVQIADYRNFAHGRHHWLAKRGNVSAVLAFSADADRLLATKTVSLLPKEIPLVHLNFDGDFLQVSLASLLTVLHVAGWAGEARAIDPGRPGVPEFGRRLFRLAVPKPTRSFPRSTVASSDSAAIERKTGVAIRRLEERGDLPLWEEALANYKRQLTEAQYGAVVFDYDGTLVDARERFDPPRAEIANELSRLLDGGLVVGIATGRGSSVRRDLQSCIPRRHWSRVIVGYYNGGEVAQIDCGTSPNGTTTLRPELETLGDALSGHSELRAIANIATRHWQITLEPKNPIPEDRKGQMQGAPVGKSPLALPCAVGAGFKPAPTMRT